MSNIEERKLALLETLVKDQKLLIEQIRNLNNNVTDLMTNVRELKMPQSSGSEPSPKPAESPPNEIQHTSTRFVSNIIATSTSSNESDNSSRSNNSTPIIKNGLREFSTFVSKMVKQKFGSSYLALTRINELDRYTMQRIKEEAIAKYLPPGVSSQFAWNHAMNSLRQLRHRQCKKAKANSQQNEYKLNDD